jgi:hypothetical protein
VEHYGGDNPCVASKKVRAESTIYIPHAHLLVCSGGRKQPARSMACHGHNRTIMSLYNIKKHMSTPQIRMPRNKKKGSGNILNRIFLVPEDVDIYICESTL